MSWLKRPKSLTVKDIYNRMLDRSEDYLYGLATADTRCTCNACMQLRKDGWHQPLVRGPRL